MLMSVLSVWHNYCQVYSIFVFFWLRQELKKSQSPSVRPFQTCLEQSIFIILAQIFKQSVRNRSAVSEHSESDQGAIRENSESNPGVIREQ